MVRKKLSIGVAVAALMLAGADASAKKRRGIALFPIVAMDEAVAGPAQDMSTSLVKKAKAAGLPITAGKALRKRVRDPAGAAIRCGDSVGCLAKLGRKARAAKMVVGFASTTGSSVEFRILVIDVKKGRTTRTVTFELVKKKQVDLMLSGYFSDIFGVEDTTMDDALALPALPGLEDPMALTLEPPPPPGEVEPATEPPTELALAPPPDPPAGGEDVGPAGGDGDGEPDPNVMANTAAEAARLEAEYRRRAEEAADAEDGGAESGATDAVDDPLALPDPPAAGALEVIEANAGTGTDLAAIDSPPPPPPTESGPGALFYAGIATVGAGAVTAGIGIAFGTMRNGIQAQLDETDASGVGVVDQIEADLLREEGNGHAQNATIMFAVGGSLAAIGGIMMALDFALAGPDEPQVEATVGPGQVGLRVRW